MVLNFELIRELFAQTDNCERVLAFRMHVDDALLLFRAFEAEKVLMTETLSPEEWADNIRSECGDGWCSVIFSRVNDAMNVLYFDRPDADNLRKKEFLLDSFLLAEPFQKIDIIPAVS